MEKIMPEKLNKLLGVVFVLCLLLSVGSVATVLAGEAEESAKPKDDMLNLNVEDLFNIEVTSVSKKTQKLANAAAAVFVITQDDIRRSGATSIPEVLRIVPGLEVARINATRWAISSRGFNHLYANKLLVLMDGRVLYTPTVSGVDWDLQDTLLEDIDRIEVIRGPGATLWGDNAVNGVINIMTKHAQQTQGALVTGGAGNEERGFGGVRYGARVGDDSYYRIYAKYFNRDKGVDSMGHETPEQWDLARGGFRFDSEPARGNALTIQGDIFAGKAGEQLQTVTLAPPFTTAFDDRRKQLGGNILGRWQRSNSDTSKISLQSYYDHNELQDQYATERLDSFAVEFQHQLLIIPRNELVWGVGYRSAWSTLRDELAKSGRIPVSPMNPVSRQLDFYNAFLQDEIALVPEQLVFTIGTKLEHNDYTGFELQPNVRLAWMPSEKHTLWGAVSRAVRTPSRLDSDSRVNYAAGPNPDPVTNSFLPSYLAVIFGNKVVKAENVIAYEAGYRSRPLDWLSVDISAFYNVYKNLQTGVDETPFVEMSPTPHIVVPMRFINVNEENVYGAEVAANLKPVESWRIIPGYTWLHMQQVNGPSMSGPHDNPQHQFSLRSEVDLPYALEFDSALYYVDNLSSQGMPSYVRVDARLGWKPLKNLELALVGQNLFDGSHSEFGGIFVLPSLPSQVERSIYGKVTWRY